MSEDDAKVTFDVSEGTAARAAADVVKDLLTRVGDRFDVAAVVVDRDDVRRSAAFWTGNIASTIAVLSQLAHDGIATGDVPPREPGPLPDGERNIIAAALGTWAGAVAAGFVPKPSDKMTVYDLKSLVDRAGLGRAAGDLIVSTVFSLKWSTAAEVAAARADANEPDRRVRIRRRDNKRRRAHDDYLMCGTPNTRSGVERRLILERRRP